MRRTTTFRLGIWLAVGLAVIDIAGLLTFAMSDAPDDAPATPILLAGAVLGVVTLLAIRPAFRESRTGLAIVVGSRALSALLSVPAYFSITNSTGPAVLATVFIALSVIAIALLASALRSASVHPVHTT